jgi:hypothetical protein
MKHRPVLAGFVASVLFAAIQPADAQLPSLDKAPWLGHFAAFKNKKFQIGITGLGKMTLLPMGDKDAPMGQSLSVPIHFGIEEVLPDGKAALKAIKPETLESAQPANDDFETLVIRGKVTGDASFEVTIEQKRGVISIGGRVVDPGTLTKNPLRFAVRARFPTAYPTRKGNDKKDDKDRKDDKDKKVDKVLLKQLKDDRIDLKWTDGKRVKQTFEEEVIASSKEINGPGISAAAIEIGAYKGKKFLFIASENSAMTLSNEKEGPLHLGFTVNWSADATKDTEGKARLSFEVK